MVSEVSLIRFRLTRWLEEIMYKKIMTPQGYINSHKSQMFFSGRNYQLKKFNYGEPLKAITIPRRDGKLSFQCNCGEIYQFYHTENREGIHLEVMLS